jgi:fused signal recognition particle receptor
MFNSLREQIKKFIGRTEEIATEKEIKEIRILSENVTRKTEDTALHASDKTTGQMQTVKRPTEPVWLTQDAGPSKQDEKEVKLTAMTQIKGIFKKTVRLTEKDLDGILTDLQMDLIQNDVALETSEAILEELKERLLDKDIDKDSLDLYIRVSIKKTLFDILTPDKEVDLLEMISEGEKPFKIIFFGVNGTGKTTTIAKMARYLMDNDLSVVIAAGDTFRAGAIEQIEKHANNLGVKVIKHQKTADAAAVIYDAIEHAKARSVDAVLADTAGRMQTNANLMDEMKKIVRVNKPDLKIFIGDSLTGNDALEQAETFNNEIGIDAVILTKMDADAKGGSALSISHITKRPVIYVGMGQTYKDLKKFDREWFINQIID